jgi:glycosyltransferase involved in cell wall biosynthesis
MKINYITNARIPTSRAYGYPIMKMCEEFSKAGTEVELIIPKRRSNVDEQDPFFYYGIEPVFKIRRIFSFDFLGMSEKFGKLTFWFDTIFFLLLIRIKGLIGAQSIIYTRDYILSFFVSSRSFLCLEIHNIPNSKFFFKWGLMKADVIFVLSPYIKEDLLKLGIDGEKIFTKASGIDIKLFNIKVDKDEAKRALGLPLNKKIVMYIGFLDKWKGVETLLKVSHLLDDIQVVIIGNGPELSRFKREYPEAIFTGSLPYRDLPFNQQAADVLVAPNSGGSPMSNLYTSPLKIIAYMASGIPIIASDLPSIREFLNKDNAFLVKPDDSELLALTIKKALVEDNREMTKKAFMYAERSSWKKRAESIINIIRNLIVKKS